MNTAETKKTAPPRLHVVPEEPEIPETPDYVRGWQDCRKVAEADMTRLRQVAKAQIRALLDIIDSKLEVNEQDMRIIRTWPDFY